MPFPDRNGLPLSTASSDAADHYRHGIDAMLALWTGAPEALDAAIAADPGFALAVAARARQHMVDGQGRPARSMIREAMTLVGQRGDERERHHVAVLAAAIEGRSAQAQQGAFAHAERWPADAMIVSLLLGAFGLLAFSGMADHDQARATLCDRIAGHYPKDDWWFLTFHGWSHGENGNLSLGRALTERAMAIRDENANGAHALAHVMYESGDRREAEAYVDRWLPGYDPRGLIHGHIVWHQALHALDRDDPGAALDLYRRHVAPGVSHGVSINVVSDVASLLWRLQADGQSVPAHLWREAADHANGHFPRAGFAFIDVHMAMIAAATGDRAALQARVDGLRALVAQGALPAGEVVPTICEALQAFVDERYAQCAAALASVMPDVVRIGGSGAQREVVEDTLLLAHLRAGQAAEAREILDRRLSRRPAGRDERWRAMC